jgi:hypothetical protein
MAKRLVFSAVTAAIIVCSTNAHTQSPAEPAYVKTRFSIDVHGNFGGYVLSKLDPTAVIVAVEAGCLAFGTDCTSQAAAAGKILQQIKAADNHGGNEHHGIFNSPPGYEICKAKIDYGHSGFSANATFASRIVRQPNQNGLGFYADVAPNPGEGTGVDADIYMQFVPAGTTSQYACWPNGGIPWNCHGHGGCDPKPDIMSTAYGIYPPARY